MYTYVYIYTYICIIMYIFMYINAFHFLACQCFLKCLTAFSLNAVIRMEPPVEQNRAKKRSDELLSNNSSLRGFQAPQVFCWSQGNGLLQYPGNII